VGSSMSYTVGYTMSSTVGSSMSYTVGYTMSSTVGSSMSYTVGYSMSSTPGRMIVPGIRPPFSRRIWQSSSFTYLSRIPCFFPM